MWHNGKIYPMKEAMRRYAPMHYNGRTYLSVEDAVCDCAVNEYPYYVASAICIDDSKVDGSYPLYTVLWNVKPDFVEIEVSEWNSTYDKYRVICEDEFFACDWEHPSDVFAGNDYYNPVTGEIFC